jgi:DNA-binding transcriptional LysR family regulator
MELRHLRYFVAVAEALHFARAAELLGIAPPTLTIQIQEIERTLSAKLLMRTKRSVALTSAGEVFLAEARNVLAQFAKAETAGRRAGRGEIGRLEVGYVGSAAYAGVLQEQTSLFRRSWPGVDINARELPMEDLPRLLDEGHVDIGFVRLPLALSRSLRMHILVRDHFCIAIPADHPQAADPSHVRPKSLAASAFIVPEQEAGTREVARRGKFTPNIISTPGSLLAVLTQVSLGAGISVIPSILTTVVRMPNVVFRPLAGDPIPSEVAAIFRANEHSPTVKKLIDQIVRSPEVHLRAAGGNAAQSRLSGRRPC